MLISAVQQSDSVINIYMCVYIYIGFPGGSDGKEFSQNMGDLGSIPGLEDPL